MSTYRIININKPGFYNYYRVQERFLFFFWYDVSRAFDEIKQAQAYIKDQEIVETKTVVHTE